MITRDQAKKYMHLEIGINDDLIDSLIDSLILASDLYIKNNSLPNYKSDAISDLAQCMLVSHWYENREAIGKADKLAFSLDSLLTQIKYCSETVEVPVV